MQPNNQQGSVQPDQGQPVVPVPPQGPVVSPIRAPTPINPATSIHNVGIAPVVDPNALQAALSEPTPVPTNVAPPVAGPTEQDQTPVVDQQPEFVADETTDTDDATADEEYDDDEAELSDEPVSWVAQEYIHHERGALWFFLFGLVIVALGAVAIFTQEWIFMVLIIIIAIVILVYIRRPPRQLTYAITDDGLTIDGELHKFSAFKSFGIIHDGLEFSVMLIPTQRFQPGLSVYFPEEAGEDIVDMLGSRLPMKDLKLDAVDRIVRVLRLQ